MASFYNATGGAEWKDDSLWLSDLSAGIWTGVVYYRDERLVPGPAEGTQIVGGVSELMLEGNGLKGQIPPELGNFRISPNKNHHLTSPLLECLNSTHYCSATVVLG